MEMINLLISKYWAGTITQAEQEELFRLLEEHDAAWMLTLREQYESGDVDATAVLSESSSEKVLQQLHVQLRSGRVIRYRTILKRVSVAAVLLLFAGWGTYTYFTHLRMRPITAQGLPVTTLAHFHNNTAQAVSKYLPDQTMVSLQSGSTIHYAISSTDSAYRHIQLEGAALFDVATDASHPFRVSAGGFTITALGTVFRVDQRDDARLSVQLLSGKVSVQAASGSNFSMPLTHLTPGQELIVNKTSKIFRVQSFKDEQHIADTGGASPVLAFNKVSVADVLQQVARHYHIQIKADTAAISGLSFTGTFISSEPVDNVLQVICNMNDLTFSKGPEGITVRKSN
ncbi:FecR domain-containing protein [Chitinophaga pendula]|uniref:FecR family protein n=1 Tax=Chitinophaga TaxID=79328 RepID=UPI000BAF106F|nr:MULTISPECIES: FecR domain-containing protein [Chitinophaga]ASZ12288.1 hypothetical protein CK934_15625 [Chitinophaga sp. MD30]UCJ10123.1 FecR domain-containing protein [Chitinophaga pendula]